MAENALVSGVCVGLRASVLGWDCATHLPNGFTLREKEDVLSHVAPLSPLQSGPPSPAPAAPQPLGHLTHSLSPLAIESRVLYPSPASPEVPTKPGEVPHEPACLKSLDQAHRTLLPEFTQRTV